MREAGLHQGVYWLNQDDQAALVAAARLRGQSVMSLAQHLLRTGAQEILRDAGTQHGPSTP